MSNMDNLVSTDLALLWDLKNKLAEATSRGLVLKLEMGYLEPPFQFQDLRCAIDHMIEANS